MRVPEEPAGTREPDHRAAAELRTEKFADWNQTQFLNINIENLNLVYSQTEVRTFLIS